MNLNPYETGGPPAMRPSIVCFADILGYQATSRGAIEAGEGDIFLQRVHSALSEAHESIRRAAQGWGDKRCFSLQVFTDNVVVGYPCDPHDFGEPELGDVLNIFSTLQATLATKGFFLRGGIAYGNHYMDEEVVFGDALLAAVALDRRGGPPRLALDQSAVDLVRDHVRFYRRVEETPHYRHLLRDSDGVIFLDYLAEAFINFPDAGVFFDLLEAHQQSVIDGLTANRSVPDVRAKFEWAARYHNYVCSDFVESHPEPDFEGYDSDPEYAAAASEARATLDYLIDVESLAARPTHIAFESE